MKLDNKWFPAFMAVVAILTAVAIVFSSLSYKETQKERFEEAILESDSLLTKPLRLLQEADSVSISEFRGNSVVVVFQASWSEKSAQLLDEMLALKDEIDSLTIISAQVLDAEESIDFSKLNPSFIYVDGASLFNDLKVPGIPSYVVFDNNNEFVYAHVGYQENAGYGLLKEKLNE